MTFDELDLPGDRFPAEEVYPSSGPLLHPGDLQRLQEFLALCSVKSLTSAQIRETWERLCFNLDLDLDLEEA